MEGVAFHKYEGLGNDFLLVQQASDEPPAFDVVRACDRHFGVGADGVLFVLPSREPGGDARMRVVNADGSVPEMCGNGVRCVALHLARARGAARATVVLETDAGRRECAVDDSGGRGLVEVDMGLVRVGDDVTLAVEGRELTLTLSDAGNPHAILFGDFTAAEIDALGPRLATHPRFPAGTNVEFARVRGDGVDLVVWERGVGRTLACGTGACATVAAACARGRLATSTEATVRLPGGPLRVRIGGDGRATMTGPARRVVSGVLARE
jgi:diaminopimelate epimerase